MTKKAAKTEEHEEAQAPQSKGGRKLMPLMFAGVFAGAALAGAGTWFYLKPSRADAAPSAPNKESKASEQAPVKQANPVYVTPELFTVNLADRDHYLQLGIVYQVDGGETAEAIKVHMPVIRSRILLLLSSKTIDDLASSQGKSALAAELLAAVRESLPPPTPADAVAQVHYSSFVIQ
jgi:flagellar FliL protein